jgi:hypothetical protein
MKDAIGIFNNWKCPTCMKMVKTPAIWKRELSSDFEVADGICKCGERLHFIRPIPSLPIVKAGVNELSPELELSGKEGVIRLEEINKEFQTKIKETQFPGLREKGRPIIIDFLNQQRLLTWLEKRAGEKGLFLSEVIIGLVEKSVLKILKEEK